MRQFGNRSGHLDPGWPCPHQHKRQERLAFLWISLISAASKARRILRRSMAASSMDFNPAQRVPTHRGQSSYGVRLWRQSGNHTAPSDRA